MVKKSDASVKQCAAEGCNSLVHARGYCWKHERSVLGIDPAIGKALAVSETQKREDEPVVPISDLLKKRGRKPGLMKMKVSPDDIVGPVPLEPVPGRDVVVHSVCELVARVLGGLPFEQKIMMAARIIEAVKE